MLRNQQVVRQRGIPSLKARKLLTPIEGLRRFGENLDDHLGIEDDILLGVMKLRFTANYQDVRIGEQSFLTPSCFRDGPATHLRVFGAALTASSLELNAKDG